MRVMSPQHRTVDSKARALSQLPVIHIQRAPFPQPAAPCANLEHLRNSSPLNAHGQQLWPAPRASLVARGLARTVLAQPGIEGDPLAFLEVSEAYWRALRNQKHEPHKKGPTVVTYVEGPLPPSAMATAAEAATGNGTAASAPTAAAAEAAEAAVRPGQQPKYDYDVVICGGTLGLFLATALQLRGWRVAIVEKRLVQGRNQEWNISWGELEVLVELGLLGQEELRAAVVSEFNPIRVGFLGGTDMWTADVLNLGVHPRRLLEALRRRFAATGGVVYENTAFRSAAIHTDGLRLKLTPGGSAQPLAVGDTNRPNGLGSVSSSSPAPRALNCRLLLDCMGHYSDIVKQIRGRVKPDGMCMVVGSCAEGFPADSNVSADLLYSLSQARYDMQLFWEAFPAEGGAARTTYMFAYSDAHPERPSFEQLLDTYFELLPEYQGLPLEQLRFKRVLFGGFPCYSNGPLAPAFDRVMQIGDASAAQSPLSFGGFGSMMRHLGRLTRGLDQALAEDRLARSDLSWLHPYQPSLSASWLFQRSMSFGVGQVSYPLNYPYTPPYYTAAAAASGAQPEAGDAAEALLLGAGAGPAAAFQEAVAMAAARFAAGAADPADYFHEELDLDTGRPMATATATAVAAGSSQPPTVAAAAAGKPTAAAPQQQQLQQHEQQQQKGQRQQSQLFERDFRSSLPWLRLPYSHVNEILGCNFGVMGVLGDRVLRPFLQDTIQLVPLSLSMVGMMLANPVTVSRVLLQVGPRTLFGWFAHYGALLVYSVAYQLLRPLRQLVPYYGFQRLLDSLEYGSGSDYRYHVPSIPSAPPVMTSTAPRGDAVAVTAGTAAVQQQAPVEKEEVELVRAGNGNGDGGEEAESVRVAAAAAVAAAPPLADAVGPKLR